eukprot:2190281-Amphidinium_carterae.1
MSPSTSALKELISRTDGMASADGLLHSLHVVQVSQMLGMRSNVSLWSPAARSMRCIAAALACHHRKCSLRKIRRFPPSVACLRPRSEECKSNRLQSVGVMVVVPCSARAGGRWRGCLSGPRPARASAGSASG